MGINDILRPKTKREIDQSLADVLAETPTLIEFVVDHNILQYHRVLKAYHYIADLIKTSPEELYIIYQNHQLYKLLKPKLDHFEALNHPIKNVKFMGGPFSHALVKKKAKHAELYGGSVSAIMVSLDHIIEMVNIK